MKVDPELWVLVHGGLPDALDVEVIPDEVFEYLASVDHPIRVRTKVARRPDVPEHVWETLLEDPHDLVVNYAHSNPIAPPEFLREQWAEFATIDSPLARNRLEAICTNPRVPADVQLAAVRLLRQHPHLILVYGGELVHNKNLTTEAAQELAKAPRYSGDQPIRERLMDKLKQTSKGKLAAKKAAASKRRRGRGR